MMKRKREGEDQANLLDQSKNNRKKEEMRDRGRRGRQAGKEGRREGKRGKEGLRRNWRCDQLEPRNR